MTLLNIGVYVHNGKRENNLPFKEDKATVLRRLIIIKPTMDIIKLS